MVAIPRQKPPVSKKFNFIINELPGNSCVLELLQDTQHKEG